MLLQAFLEVFIAHALIMTENLVIQAFVDRLSRQCCKLIPEAAIQTLTDPINLPILLLQLVVRPALRLHLQSLEHSSRAAIEVVLVVVLDLRDGTFSHLGSALAESELHRLAYLALYFRMQLLGLLFEAFIHLLERLCGFLNVIRHQADSLDLLL